jgi:hypothetical protein
MGTDMRCYLNGDNLVIEFQSNGTSEIVDNKTIKYIPNRVISVFVGKGVKPVDALNEVKSKLLEILIIDGDSFDSVVAATMRNLSMENIESDKVKTRKNYAKYFYTMFMNRNKTDLERNSSDSGKLALILIELISWWFIRRAVHVFVVSTILERVGVKDNTIKPTMNFQVGPSISAPSTSNSTSARDCKAEVDLITAQFNAELAKLKNEKSAANSSSVVVTKQFTEIETKYKDLEALVNVRNDRVAELEIQLDNYKQLLLESTSMIFKMDEIPNMLQIKAP